MHLARSRGAAARPGAAVALLATAGVLWGTGGLLGRLLGDVTGLGPTAVAAYRLTLGGAVLGAVLLLARRPLPRRVDAWRRIVATGALAALYQACYFGSVALTSVSLATLVTLGSAPVVVITVERLTGRRGADRRLAGAVALALVGLALLVGVPAGGADAGSPALGAALAMVAGAGFAGITLLAARPVPELDDLTTAGLAFPLGGLLLLPLALATAGLGFTPSPAGVALLLALAVVPTALAYTAYFRGLRGSVAGVGAVMALLEPLTAALLAALLLGERLGAVGIVGAVLLGTAVLLTATTTGSGGSRA
ncbi:MAG TPA: EamA family transporter [Pseudonocardia sp.]|jgi:drug/metabolite transporter, DME family|nr:EamA family transporter [Pseudonocardia sp.]